MTGQTLNIWYDAVTSEHKLSMGDQTATILRPDIVLENGVLHIIDKVLTVPSGAEDEPLRSMRQPDPTGTDAGGQGKAAVQESGKPKSTDKGTDTGPGTGSGAESSGMASKAVSVQLTLLAVLLGAVTLLVE